MRHKHVALFVGPCLFVGSWLLPAPEGLAVEGWHALGIGLWMALWWMTEAVPIPVTSLLPLIVFPVVGLRSMADTAAPYANPLIFLFMGGFILALGMERCQLHRRIALGILKRVGTRPRGIVAGFMLACALLSMWVTNTATTMMMLPIGLSVVSLARERLVPAQAHMFGVALMLGIAYACTIGGLGTLIGTVPNALAAAFMSNSFGIQLGFGQWMLFGVPLMVVGLPVTWFVLTRVAFRLDEGEIPGMRDMMGGMMRQLGPMTRDERWVSAVFGVVVLLWLTRPLLNDALPGVTDTGIALFGAALLFVLPSADVDEQAPWSERFLMTWREASRLPWGILILFGGGLSLAAVLSQTGFATWLGGLMAYVGAWPVLVVIFVVTGVVILLTELTSNTATTAAFLPVMASVALGIGQDPLLLVIPATVAASAAFMLPVATPPNAIVFGSDLITIPDMARTGAYLNVAFTVIISVLAYVLVQIVFDVTIGVVPDYATEFIG